MADSRTVLGRRHASRLVLAIFLVACGADPAAPGGDAAVLVDTDVGSSDADAGATPDAADAPDGDAPDVAQPDADFDSGRDAATDADSAEDADADADAGADADADADAGCADEDEDGVCDDVDQCPGSDDAEDADEDGVPDGCDICPDAEDAFDSDEDGVPDGCDVCEGGDDAVDSDSDGVPDGCDVCEGGDDAVDSDGDGTADFCDLCEGSDDTLDTDEDGIPNGCDTCDGADVDTDGDGVADACDLCEGEDDTLDDDGDGVPDGCDVCPDGDDTADGDGDGVPDDCDECPLDSGDDSDGDGVCDTDDICPDGDDGDDGDGDGVPDECDECPLDNPDDSDGDGVCDTDDICPDGDDDRDWDRDGVPDGCDICPRSNPDDSDGDGVCERDDACPGFDDDEDADRDGAPDGCDPCPLDNPDDSDGDGVCDTDDVCAGGDDSVDDDEDGVANHCDICPLDNPDDVDGDGVCDSDEICPGGDDLVDDNGDGVPDDCECDDDWDCPAFLTCRGGVCSGTGDPPSCTVPVVESADWLPTMEPGFPWGGVDRSDPDATGHPFPASSQVTMTPLVVNLDDDNGDGLINDFDTPEIVFLTFCGSQFTSNGVLRAVHAGGPDRGQDLFASCGSTVWNEGDAIDTECACGDADLDSTAGLAAGDIDGDGIPEIVAIDETDRMRIYSNLGALLLETTFNLGSNPSPAIADLDGDGFAEVIVGRSVYRLGRAIDGAWLELEVLHGGNDRGAGGQGPISLVADLDGDGRQEIIAGPTVYRYPSPPAGVTLASECSGSETDPEHVAYCSLSLVTEWDGGSDGFSAVADVYGADGLPASLSNPLDGVPEIIVSSGGRLEIFSSTDGTQLLDVNLPSGGSGAPVVDDFDGDGFPEIGMALDNEYILSDLQAPTAACPGWPNRFDDGVAGLQGNPERTPPSVTCETHADCGDTGEFACNDNGACVCLHNGWMRRIEDDSSRVTASTAFDLNGDGESEVLYNDECYLRVYAGRDGSVILKENNPSRTRTENPVVADVDGDGNAEIVVPASNESGFCSEGNDFNNGIEVWGDAADGWAPARSIWNQHTYHLSNVTEAGAIPVHPAPSWVPFAGPDYNSFRAQSSPGRIAPDLEVRAIQLSPSGSGCGAVVGGIDIAIRVVNVGDEVVGAGTTFSFHGEWDPGEFEEPLYADEASTPLVVSLDVPLLPGAERVLSTPYDPVHSTRGLHPARVRVVADPLDVTRECDEDNNSLTVAVGDRGGEPELRLSLDPIDGTCPSPRFAGTVRNRGGSGTGSFVIHFFAGHPEAGGRLVHEYLVGRGLAAGEDRRFGTTALGLSPLDVEFYAVVDALEQVAECNDGNNVEGPFEWLCAP